MIELNLNLKSFNGPLDLLLSLVKDNKMDINAIDIELLADQYLNFLKTHTDLLIDDMSEYLVMASALIWIKSKSMLNSIMKLSEEEQKDLDEKKKRIISQIILYKQYCDITKNLQNSNEQRLKLHSQNNADNKSTSITNILKVVSMPKQVNPLVLQKALINVHERWKLNIFNTYNKIIVQEVSAEQVEKEMTRILENIKKDKIKQISLSDFLGLFDQNLLTDQFFTTCFVSLLDLAKNQVIVLNQKEFNSEIYIDIL